MDAAYQGCLPSCKLHSKSLWHCQACRQSSKFIDCKRLERNLRILRMCSAISRLHKFSDCAEPIYNRLKALASRVWSVTEIGKTQQLSSLIPRPSIAAQYTWPTLCYCTSVVVVVYTSFPVSCCKYKWVAGRLGNEAKCTWYYMYLPYSPFTDTDKMTQCMNSLLFARFGKQILVYADMYSWDIPPLSDACPCMGT